MDDVTAARGAGNQYDVEDARARLVSQRPAF